MKVFPRTLRQDRDGFAIIPRPRCQTWPRAWWAAEIDRWPAVLLLDDPIPPLSSASCSDHWRTFTCRPSYASQRVYVDVLVLTDQSRTALNRAGNTLLVLGPLGPRVAWQNTRYMPGKPGMASSGTDLRKTICVCFMLGWLILWWTISDSAHFDYKIAHRREFAP